MNQLKTERVEDEEKNKKTKRADLYSLNNKSSLAVLLFTTGDINILTLHRIHNNKL